MILSKKRIHLTWPHFQIAPKSWHQNLCDIMLWYYLKRGSTSRDLTFRLRQNLGAKTFVHIRVEDDSSPHISWSDPLVGSDHLMYYIYFHHVINKLLRNLTPLWQHLLLLYVISSTWYFIKLLFHQPIVSSTKNIIYPSFHKHIIYP
jgi:hypothetical protein